MLGGAKKRRRPFDTPPQADQAALGLARPQTAMYVLFHGISATKSGPC